MLGFLLSPALARADAAACVAAADHAQSALEQKKLVDTATAAAVCAAKECPDVVRNDCVRWLKQAKREVATVVFRVVNRSSEEIGGARVVLDHAGDKREVPAGEPIDVDPGAYSITYVGSGVRGEKSVTFVVGEKNDGIVVLAEPVQVAPTAGTPSARAAAWPWPWMAGGVAVVGFAVFGVLQLTASHEFSDLRDTCGKNSTVRAGCSDDQVSPVHTQVAVSGVGLGVGIVAGAAAVVLFVLQPKTTVAQSRFVPRPGGGALQFAF